MKKIALAALAAATSLMLFSCGDKKGSKSSKNVPEYQGVKAEIDPATGKVYDFDGMEVTLYDWWTNPDAAPSSRQEEDQRAFRQWLMDTYNFKIVQKNLSGWDNYPKEVANIVMSGTKDNVAFIIDGRSAISGQSNDFWYDLSKVKNVDWSKDKWNQGVIDILRNGNSFYTFATGKSEPREGMFFNKRILEENGFNKDEPYDLQKEGKWTWEAFEDMCKKITKDTNNDGVIDQYAMASFYTSFGMAAVYSNGGAKVRYVDGKFVDAIGEEKSMEAWNWVYDMFAKYQLPQGDRQWDYWQNAFVNGEVAFLAMQQYIAHPNNALSQMKDDFGFVSFPLGPHGDHKVFTLTESNMWVIPNIYKDDNASKIMKILDFYTDDVPGYGGPDSWKEVSYLQGFRDDRALDETVTMMLENTYERLDKMIPDYSQEYMVNWISHGWGTPQEVYEREKAEIQSRLDAVNK